MICEIFVFFYNQSLINEFAAKNGGLRMRTAECINIIYRRSKRNGRGSSPKPSVKLAVFTSPIRAYDRSYTLNSLQLHYLLYNC